MLVYKSWHLPTKQIITFGFPEHCLIIKFCNKFRGQRSSLGFLHYKRLHLRDSLQLLIWIETDKIDIFWGVAAKESQLEADKGAVMGVLSAGKEHKDGGVSSAQQNFLVNANKLH